MTNMITVQLNIPPDDNGNIDEVFGFLYARHDAGYTTIFNLLREPERYEQDLELLEQARDAGAVGILSVENDDYDDDYFAVFPTDLIANKFAQQTGNTVQIFNPDNQEYSQWPIEDVIETLESWEQRPKGKEMFGQTVVFVGRTFCGKPKKAYKESANRIGANVARRITANVDYVVFSEYYWREPQHDKYLEQTQAVGAIPLNEDQWRQIVVDCR